jgi:hypothetical protein
VNPDCAAHAGVAATHRCDGCERMLCEECFEIGHRLLFCVHCGERALQLASDSATSSLFRARREDVEAVYG